MATNVDIKGLNKLIKDLRKLGIKGQQAIEDTTEDIAFRIALDASNAAPTNKRITGGDLKQGIIALPIDKNNWKVLAKPKYAAYMEFGTGGLVEVPAELQDVAIKFKGKGIRQVNLRPQPYLYPAFVKGRINYIKDLEAELTRLTKQV